MNTTKKVTRGQARVRRGVQKDGWTPLALRGVCGFWDGSYDNGRHAGGIVLMAFSEPHGWFTSYKNVVFYQGIVPWMLKWVDARCLLTM